MIYQSYMLPPVVTKPQTESMFERYVFRTFFKYPYGFNLINMEGANTTMTEKIVQKVKIFSQTIMQNQKLIKNCVSARVQFYEHLQTKLSMGFFPGPNLLAEGPKPIHLQCITRRVARNLCGQGRFLRIRAQIYGSPEN